MLRSTMSAVPDPVDRSHPDPAPPPDVPARDADPEVTAPVTAAVPWVIVPARPEDNGPDDGASLPPVSLVKPPPPVVPAGKSVWEYDPPPSAPAAPLDPSLAALRQVFVTLALLALGFLIELTLLGGLQHDRNQAQAFAELRIQLADGTAPVGPTDFEGRVLDAGTPVAILEIPRLDLTEVVLEGPTARVMMSGPGHQRDSVLPGQVGTAVVLGRRGAFGGPFRDLDELSAGDPIVVTTGQGRHEFTVLGPRRAGDPLRSPPAQGAGRLILVTTDGPIYQPTGVLFVDADLTTPAQPRPAQIPRGAAPDNEDVASGDSTALLPLLLWGVLLVAAAVGVVWVAHRVGRWQAWIIGFPVLGLFGVLAVDSAAALLPNIL